MNGSSLSMVPENVETKTDTVSLFGVMLMEARDHDLELMLGVYVGFNAVAISLIKTMMMQCGPCCPMLTKNKNLMIKEIDQL